MAAPAVEKAA